MNLYYKKKKLLDMIFPRCAMSRPGAAFAPGGRVNSSTHAQKNYIPILSILIFSTLSSKYCHGWSKEARWGDRPLS